MDFENKMNTHLVVNNEPWLKQYPENVHWNAPLETMPLGAFFDKAMEKFRERPGVDFLGKKYTHGEIEKLTNQFAKGMQNIGVKKGTKVGLCLPNTPYSIICYFGALKAGATIVNFNPLYVERELAYQINDSETEIMVTIDLDLIYPKVKAMLGRTSLKKIIICKMSEALPGFKSLMLKTLKSKHVSKISADAKNIPFGQITKNDGNYQNINIDPKTDIAVLQYTGGTSGTPKGAMLTHANITASVAQILAYTEPMQLLIGGEEKLIGLLPFFHVFAMNAVMNLGIAIGAEIILLPRFDVDLTLKSIHRTKATVLAAVPTIYTALNTAHNLSKYDLSSLKYCNSGGAPLPEEVHSQFKALTGSEILEGYGLSETAALASCMPPNGPDKPGSIGIPVAGTIMDIRDPDNIETVLLQGEKGEICVRGPQVMKGYWRRSEESRQACKNGLLRTGDIGYMDADGYFFIVDRIKDLILCSGYNVYPRMIEEAIYLHPFVEEVSVIGIADKYRGQSPKAFVKLHAGKTLQDTELKDFLKDKLSKIEMPAQIEFRSELPKTLIGKLSKKELVADEKAKLQMQDIKD